MSATWSCGTPISRNNAFNIGFVQPIAPTPSAPTLARYTRPGYVAPREVVVCDAVDKRLALNSAGKFVSVCMGRQKPSLTIATESDNRVIRKREAAI